MARIMAAVSQLPQQIPDNVKLSVTNHNRLREDFATMFAASALRSVPIAGFFGLKVFIDPNMPDDEVKVCCGDQVVRIINLDARPAGKTQRPRQT